MGLPVSEDATRRPPGYGAAPLVLAAVTAVLLVICAGLDAVLPREPASLRLLELLPRAARQQAGARVAAMHGQPFSAVVGLSSVRDGVDRDRLAQADPDHDWIVVCTGGGSITQLRHVARPLLLAEPAPRRVVLGLHAAWLVDAGLAQLPPARGNWLDVRGPVQMALWPWRNRNGMTLLIHHLAGLTRLSVLPRLGVSLPGLYRPSDDPFAPDYETGDEPAGAGHMADQLINWTERGWFDPASYRDDAVEVRRLLSLIDALRTRGSRVLVVRMPESSPWRARMPAEAAQTLMRVLGTRMDPEDVLDLSTAVPDEQMHDHSHVSATGRAAVTAKIAAFVRRRAG